MMVKKKARGKAAAPGTVTVGEDGM